MKKPHFAIVMLTQHRYNSEVVQQLYSLLYYFDTPTGCFDSRLSAPNSIHIPDVVIQNYNVAMRCFFSTDIYQLYPAKTQSYK